MFFLDLGLQGQTSAEASVLGSPSSQGSAAVQRALQAGAPGKALRGRLWFVLEMAAGMN